MKWPRKDWLVLEDNEDLLHEMRHLDSYRKNALFFGMGNSYLGLVTPLSARLQQRACCRVLPKLCLRSLSSHPRSSRRFEKTTIPNQLLFPNAAGHLVVELGP